MATKTVAIYLGTKETRAYWEGVALVRSVVATNDSSLEVKGSNRCNTCTRHCCAHQRDVYAR